MSNGSAAQPSPPHDELSEDILLIIEEDCAENADYDIPAEHNHTGAVKELQALILAQRQEAVREALERLSAAAETHATPIYGVTNRQIHDLLQTYLEER